ncbi:MAG: 6,7-dimethyl-8-ribityllumazine synthase [Gammaproteobacteria bacterium]|nr:6,7-dimethyl-8-ribityllumazine synthase [Gammaproteobacteria bacterium]
MKTIEGHFSVSTARITIVAARFNHFIVDSLVDGAVDTLKRHGISDNNLTLVRVPGAFELPLAAKKIVQKRSADAIIALGTVIRGATPHFDYVCSQCASGLMNVSLDSGVPVAFGVLTTETIEQAIERSGTKAGNKGADAAMTALEMIGLLRSLDD